MNPHPSRRACRAIAFLCAALMPCANPLHSAETELTQLWTFATAGTIMGSPAIGPLGEIVFGSHDGTVYSLNPDGSLRWTFATGDWVEAAPTIAHDGTVYVGSWDAFFYALDGDTGAMLWRVPAGSLFIGSAAMNPDGTLYCAADDGLVYALQPNGNLLWIFAAPVQQFDAFSASPVLNHDASRLYIGNENGFFFAINTADGSLAWSFQVTAIQNKDPAITAAAAIGEDGTIFFGSRNGNLYALAPNGALLWSFAATEAIETSPAITRDGQLVFASHDGYLYFVDTEGFQIAEVFVGDVFFSSATVTADNHILQIAYSGSSKIGIASSLLRIAPDAAIVANYTFPAFNDSPANVMPDGSILFGDHDGKLHKIQGMATVAQSAWPRFQAGRHQSGWAGANASLRLIDFIPSLQRANRSLLDIPEWGQIPYIADNLPFIWHPALGYLYLPEPDPTTPLPRSGIHFFDPQSSDWFWSPPQHPHFFYRFNSRQWLYLSPDSSFQSGRQFFELGFAPPD